MAFNPLLLAAMSDVDAERVRSRLGYRQHVVHDGRRLGLAVLASLAEADTQRLTAMGSGGSLALTHGYQAAFAASALLTLIASALAGAWLRRQADAVAAQLP